MPFEKSYTEANCGGVRALLLAALLLIASTLLLRLSLPTMPEEGAIHAVVENEAVRTFLSLDAVD